MDFVYALEDPPETYRSSIFLAGPTPRSNDVRSWRPAAIRELQQAGYGGVVFIPEDRSGAFHGDYDSQIAWEEENLNRADCILFWVPRDMRTMPAMTTNAEFGRWENSAKIVFGAPPDAPKNAYLRHYAQQHGAPTADTLADTVAHAITLCGDGADRSGGERDVPLHIWHTEAFQRWYASQRTAGNQLRSARTLWTFCVGSGQRRGVFCFALHVNMYVAAEDRCKVNEFVLARTDISSVLMYRPAESLDNTEIVLVREYRSPARTDDGFVHELPGGSTTKPAVSAAHVAAEEVHEETGLRLSADRLTAHESRQLAATLSAHHSHLFSVVLTDDEIAELRAQTEPHGVEADSERTWVEVLTFREIRERNLVDWSTLGMILSVIS
jgi:8-oxo-dGTP pyrophosphatase MutT (NUDIX family)